MENLKLLRTALGLSQKGLADILGTNQQSVHRYENGSYEPNISTLMLLAEYFDTTIDFLVGRTNLNQRIELVEKYDLNGRESGIVDKYRVLSIAHQKCFGTMLDALLVLEDDEKKILESGKGALIWK